MYVYRFLQVRGVRVSGRQRSAQVSSPLPDFLSQLYFTFVLGVFSPCLHFSFSVWLSLHVFFTGTCCDSRLLPPVHFFVRLVVRSLFLSSIFLSFSLPGVPPRSIIHLSLEELSRFHTALRFTRRPSHLACLLAAPRRARV